MLKRINGIYTNNNKASANIYFWFWSACDHLPIFVLGEM